MTALPLKDRRKFLSVLAKQNGAVIRRNGFENQFAQPAFQGFKPSDRRYRLAYSKESLKGQRVHQVLRTEVHRVVTVKHHGGSRGQALFIQFRRVAFPRDLLVSEKEQEQGMPELDFIAVSKKTFFNWKIVDVSPVDASQVEDLELVVVLLEQRVLSRQGTVRNGQVVGSLAANGELPIDEAEDASLEGSGDG